MPLYSHAQVDTVAYSGSEAYRPRFHFSPQQGWMSDPNGLVYYKGEYHLFYQHRFKGSALGMYWGHSVSPDLLHWKHLPVALSPDSLGYIFSGSCVADLKNTSGLGTAKNPPLLAFFTYHKPDTKFPESQALAYSTDKGRSWKKYAGNPVIKNPGLTDFRDPKVIWNESSKNWLMSLAAGNVIKFYTSPDGLKWTFLSEFGSDKGNHIGPWECPDFFPITVNGAKEIKWVLLVSVVDLTQTADRLTTATQYFIGNFDGKTFSANQQGTKWIDYGKDNYAGVTYNNVPGNRRIFQAWMQSHQYGGQVENAVTKTWAGAATFPREISVVRKDDEYNLAFQPVKELANLYGTQVKLSETRIDDHLDISKKISFGTSSVEIDLTFATTSLPDKYGIILKNNYNESVTLYYDKQLAQFMVDRRNSTNIKFHERFGSIQKAAYQLHGKTMEWHLLIDVASVEFFTDEGNIVFSDTFYPTRPFDQIEIFSENGSVLLKKGTVKQLKSIYE